MFMATVISYTSAEPVDLIPPAAGMIGVGLDNVLCSFAHADLP
jgi:hypothetical protein